MELHQLLLDLVANGVPSDSRIHTIECDSGHLIGYALIPNQQQAQFISVSCTQCQEIGRIGGPVKSGKPKPAPAYKPAEPPPSRQGKKDLTYEEALLISDEELERHMAQIDRKSPLYKILMRVKGRRNLAKARKTKEDRLLDQMKVMSDQVSSAWDSYASVPPVDLESDINAIIQKHPYRHKVDIDPVALFSACWIASELWTDDFVSELSRRWGFPSVSAFRGRIESIWAWLEADVRLKMPFMTKATAAPKKAEEALKKHADKAKSGSQEDAIDEDPINVVRMNAA